MTQKLPCPSPGEPALGPDRCTPGAGVWEGRGDADAPPQATYRPVPTEDGASPLMCPVHVTGSRVGGRPGVLAGLG